MIKGVERGEVTQCVPCLLLHVHGGADFLEVAHHLDDVVNHNHQANDGLQNDLEGFQG